MVTSGDQPRAQAGHFTMGFERERGVLGIVVEGERHLGQRKTCPYRKWETIYLSSKKCVQSAFS